MTTFSRVIGEVTAPSWDDCGGGSHRKSHRKSHRRSHKHSNKHSWGC
jgi:hypothetical protein